MAVSAPAPMSANCSGRTRRSTPANRSGWSAIRHRALSTDWSVADTMRLCCGGCGCLCWSCCCCCFVWISHRMDCSGPIYHKCGNCCAGRAPSYCPTVCAYRHGINEKWATEIVSFFCFHCTYEIIFKLFLRIISN